MKNTKKLTAIIIVSVVILGAAVFAVVRSKDSDAKANPNPVGTTVQPSQAIGTTSLADKDKTQEQLLYLIEEEKLAHDVYSVMFQKYGAKVFGNILESESTHQGKVLTLLEARGIADPRSSEIGVFKNSGLKSLYDTLITQGNQNATGAYKAGVAIEEKDIADISNQLATATDNDVITTLEVLRSGSENHLRAFNRQL